MECGIKCKLAVHIFTPTKKNRKQNLTVSDVQLICTNEPRHEKTNVLHLRKQRRRSASR